MTEARLPSYANVVILGAGPVGMTLAASLKDSRHRVRLIDRRPRGAWRADPRALAIAYGSRQLLSRLGAWDTEAATDIREIHVSQRGGWGEARMSADDYGIPALGAVVPYRALATALAAVLPAESLIDEAEVIGIDAAADSVTLTLRRAGQMEKIAADLLIHAEGTPDDGAGIITLDYLQQALVAEVRPAEPHRGRAWERFTPAGPLALLPCGENYALVLTAAPAEIDRLRALDETAFLEALRERLGRGFDFLSAGPRAAFPLALRARKALVAPRQAWIGNAAQTLHPVTGQGFNLGLRDAWELAEILHRHADAGDPQALGRYARGRALDRIGSAAFTDGLIRLFSNDLKPLRALRGLGLAGLDRLPPLKHFLARRMIWGARAGS